MPDFQSFNVIVRKDLHVFYILDTSGSMGGEPISILNHAMEETIDALRDEARKNADAHLKIAVMEFNTCCSWVTGSGPVDLEQDFEYEYLTAGGLTNMGEALTELNSKLSKNAFLDSMAGALMPILIFMTDGNATDSYGNALAQIQQNKWFKNATKIGFAIGENADEDMIAKICGDPKAVIRKNDFDQFAQLLKFVTVTSTMLQSASYTSAVQTDGAAIVQSAKDTFGDTSSWDAGDSTWSSDDDDW